MRPTHKGVPNFFLKCFKIAAKLQKIISFVKIEILTCHFHLQYHFVALNNFAVDQKFEGQSSRSLIHQSTEIYQNKSNQYYLACVVFSLHLCQDNPFSVLCVKFLVRVEPWNF